jgi:fatty acid desaturase
MSAWKVFVYVFVLSNAVLLGYGLGVGWQSWPFTAVLLAINTLNLKRVNPTLFTKDW